MGELLNNKDLIMGLIVKSIGVKFILNKVYYEEYCI